MRPIPKKLRDKMADDPYMKQCFRHKEGECWGRVEWEHAIIIAGKQLNEDWCVIPVCTYHHRLEGLDKEYNRYEALRRATDENLAKYPKSNLQQQKKYLTGKYGT